MKLVWGETQEMNPPKWLVTAIRVGLVAAGSGFIIAVLTYLQAIPADQQTLGVSILTMVFLAINRWYADYTAGA